MLLFKTKIPEVVEDEDGFAVVPPDIHYLSTDYVVKIPLTDKHLKNRWQLRLYASKMVERQLRDHVQVTNLRVKKPHFVRKTVAKLRGQVPYARAYVTIKF